MCIWNFIVCFFPKSRGKPPFDKFVDGPSSYPSRSAVPEKRSLIEIGVLRNPWLRGFAVGRGWCCDIIPMGAEKK
ncbi:MAG: hypothetical protein WC626_08955 [Methanoregula sp.]